MSCLHIPAGKNIPEDFNVIIEITAGGAAGPVKYEMDKENGVLTVDRFMTVAMYYPCSYGYVPSTLAEDGDPMDVLVLAPAPIQPGALIRVRSIGLLVMTDENGKDSKILAAPIPKVCAEYANIKSLADVPKAMLDKISHFFECYKALEPNKWVKVDGWEGKDAADKSLMESVERYKK